MFIRASGIRTSSTDNAVGVIYSDLTPILSSIDIGLNGCIYSRSGSRVGMISKLIISNTRTFTLQIANVPFTSSCWTIVAYKRIGLNN